ncbi:hypothetical protein FRA_31c04800 [Francisella sp. W12-1067]|nr:hypothetical protein FRA_31c04800 [Francisella sp. W12-1067]
MTNIIFQTQKNRNYEFDKYVNDYEKQDICYEVPFIYQNKINLCSISSFYMMLLFFKRYNELDKSELAKCIEHSPYNANIYQFYTNKGIPYIHNDNNFLVEIKKKFGFNIQHWDIRDYGESKNGIYELLDKEGPFAVVHEWKHVVLVKGIIGNNVIFHDPWSGRNLQCRYDDRSWDWTNAWLHDPGPLFNRNGIIVKKNFKTYLTEAINAYMTAYKQQGNRGLFHRHSKSGLDRINKFLENIKTITTNDSLMLEIRSFMLKEYPYNLYSGQINLNRHSGATYLLLAIRLYLKQAEESDLGVYLSKINEYLKTINPSILIIDWSSKIRENIKDFICKNCKMSF